MEMFPAKNLVFRLCNADKNGIIIDRLFSRNTISWNNCDISPRKPFSFVKNRIDQAKKRVLRRYLFMYFQKKHCVAMLLAGGQGSRLKVLTENTAKPAVPFGGKYRIIDFPLSNCVNSHIDTVGVLTQYQPLELNEYIGNGQPWDLNSSH